MDEEKLERIQSFLITNGQSIETISKARLKQIEMADYAIQCRLTDLSTAQDTIKSSAINISTIAVDAGIARKTFYNNDLLRLYVESYASSDTDKIIAASEYERLKEKYDILNQQVHDFNLRDIDIEKIRHVNSKLNLEIEILSNRNLSLERENEENQKKLSETKKKLASYSNKKVVNFPK